MATALQGSPHSRCFSAEEGVGTEGPVRFRVRAGTGCVGCPERDLPWRRPWGGGGLSGYGAAAAGKQQQITRLVPFMQIEASAMDWFKGNIWTRKPCFFPMKYVCFFCKMFLRPIHSHQQWWNMPKRTLPAAIAIFPSSSQAWSLGFTARAANAGSHGFCILFTGRSTASPCENWKRRLHEELTKTGGSSQ